MKPPTTSELYDLAIQFYSKARSLQEATALVGELHQYMKECVIINDDMGYGFVLINPNRPHIDKEN